MPATQATPEPDPARSPQGASDLSALSYEQARDELIAIVARLEGGQAPLEESMQLWQRGEALAAYCERWLDQAQERIADAGIGAPGTPDGPD